MSVFKRGEICSVSYKKDARTNINTLGSRKQERRTNLRLYFIYSINESRYTNIQNNTMKCFKLLSFCLPNKLQTA